MRTCASFPSFVTPEWHTVQERREKCTIGKPACVGRGPSPPGAVWQSRQVFVAMRWSMPLVWQSMHFMPRWTWTSSTMPRCPAVASLAAWHARQRSFFGLPTRKMQRPRSSNMRLSYVIVSGTLKRWSSGFSGRSLSHEPSRRSFMPPTEPRPDAATAAPRQFSRITWRAHSLES